MTTSKRFRPQSRDLSLPGLVEAYLLACRAEGKSARTIRWYERKLRAFVDYLRSRRLSLRISAVTPEITRGFITELQATGVSPLLAGFCTAGSSVVGVITWTPAPGMLKVSVSGAEEALASSIAARSVQAPLPALHTPSPALASDPSPVELTVMLKAPRVHWSRARPVSGRASPPARNA